MLPPLKMEDSGLTMMNEDGCKELWPAFKKIIPPHLSLLSREIVESDETFPLLVYSFMQNKIEKEKAEFKAEVEAKKLRETITSAKNIVDSLIDNYPQWIFDTLTDTRSLRNINSGGQNLDEFGRQKFIQVLHRHYKKSKEHFNRLGFRAKDIRRST